MLDCRKDFEEKFVNFSTIAIWAMLVAFFEFGEGVDRISEDKISAAMLRKFVNTVYDILRDVKIPSCCRGFLL